MSETSPTPEQAASAAALVRLMRERRISAHKLAVALGVSDRTVWRWRSAETTPDRETVNRIAALLDVDVSEITPAAETQAAIVRLHAQLNELLAELESLKRIAARSATENAELRSHLERLEKASRRPQDMLKPNAQRKAAGS